MCSSLSQRAKEDVLQKEVKVKILKDSINMMVSRTSPSGGGSGYELTSELERVLANYNKLCDRLKSKCHTLEVMFFCSGCTSFTMCNFRLKVCLLVYISRPNAIPHINIKTMFVYASVAQFLSLKLFKSLYAKCCVLSSFFVNFHAENRRCLKGNVCNSAIQS